MGNHLEIDVTNILPEDSATRTGCDRMASSKMVRDKGYAEPAATIVWIFLQQLLLSPYEVIFWNIFPFHPFKREEGRLSNRTPRMDELDFEMRYLGQLITLCPANVKIIAIGEKTAETIGDRCLKVRHPANGGVRLFREQLPKLIS